MKNFVRTALLAATLAGASFGAFAAAVPNPPLPDQDPIVQHLKLTNDQITRIKKTSPTTGNRRQSDFDEGN
ncbi:putative secreted protein [Salmonella enterica subsp. arizonae]|nr:putative secreted protein [Salmonella enterica subsp. arizonae]